ncbi:MAG: DegV family protein [Oscillospiraceae bacterium]|nr:DegV family protein [Oscillospiraceae bacterium]
MSVQIILDSTADTIPALRDRCTIVPLTVHFGDHEYLDGISMTHCEFYEKLVESRDLPTTSQPTPDAFAQEFQKIVDAGDQAVVLTISSKLSGTYQSATIAAMDFPGSIYVVDTRSVTIGAGILAELALQMVNKGMSAEDIACAISKERENVRLVAMLDTLEYLKKGGRISKTVAFAGELLSIKPIISIQEGEIHMLGKARGTRQAGVQLISQIEAAGGIDHSRPVMMGYTGVSDTLLNKFIEEHPELQGDLPLRSTIIGSVIGTHAGPGAFAAAFFTK